MDRHRRYLQQASWTRELRSYLFERAGLAASSRVLEVGCGTGAVVSDIRFADQPESTSEHRRGRIALGIDIDFATLLQCLANAPRATFSCADGLALPLANGVFDIVYCHFFLLWVRDPLAALLEMKRVARRNGQILAIAEPDYTLRIDEPADLSSAGGLQTQSLRLQGADVSIGSRLAELFNHAEIKIIETGEIGTRPFDPAITSDALDEWVVLRADLERILSADQLDAIQQQDADARRRGTRRIHVPTYFAWGQV
jgi:SAM-dependent methyltransferase